MRLLQARKLGYLALRIAALEDALAVVVGDRHPLLHQRRIGLSFDSHSLLHGEKADWMDHEMDVGMLLRKNKKAETLLGPSAVEVRTTYLYQMLYSSLV